MDRRIGRLPIRITNGLAADSVSPTDFYSREPPDAPPPFLPRNWIRSARCSIESKPPAVLMLRFFNIGNDGRLGRPRWIFNRESGWRWFDEKAERFGKQRFWHQMTGQVFEKACYRGFSGSVPPKLYRGISFLRNRGF